MKQTITITKVKYCTKCKKWKSLSEFYKEKHGRYGVRGDCKVCNIKRVQKYNHAHRAKRLEYAKIYGRTHQTKRIKYRKKYRRTIIGCLRCRFIDMKRRYNNPKNQRYKCYGDRGIKCLFENSQGFIDYIINELKIDPRDLTVDRIDNDGHYEKGNIRFVTRAENNKNRKRKND